MHRKNKSQIIKSSILLGIFLGGLFLGSVGTLLSIQPRLNNQSLLTSKLISTEKQNQKDIIFYKEQLASVSAQVVKLSAPPAQKTVYQNDAEPDPEKLTEDQIKKIWAEDLKNNIKQALLHPFASKSTHCVSDGDGGFICN